jgi:biotin carboxyl carrier protein
VSISELRELMALMRQRDLEEITVEREAEGLRLRLRRPVLPVVATAHGEVEAEGLEPLEPLEPIQPAEEPHAENHRLPVLAPLVGRFHRGLHPGAEPLVGEGDEIGEGQVLGAIETLNVFTEVEAAEAGRVARILVDDGEPVEFGQQLMLIEPHTR